MQRKFSRDLKIYHFDIYFNITKQLAYYIPQMKKKLQMSNIVELLKITDKHVGLIIS